MNQVSLPNEVRNILNVFKNEKYKAYLTGGCVRDLIMGREPNDYDISTNATPDEVKKIFNKTYDTGIKHGTVTVIYNEVMYEVTTFRIEDKYIKNRKPEKVKFTENIEEDLKRRDFTINAMAADENGNIIDLYNGINNIKLKIIKCVGEPEQRFSEDALRMLRAIRFSCQLDFEIEHNTKKWIKTLSPLINNISYERIKCEMDHIIMSQYINKGFELLDETGILKIILPEFKASIGVSQKNPYHIYDVGEHIINSVKMVEDDLTLKWTMLLHDIGKPLTKTTDNKGIDHFKGHSKESISLSKHILDIYKFDNKSKRTILKLIEYHDINIYNEAFDIKRVVNTVGEELFLDLLKIKKADFSAQNPKLYENRAVQLDQIKKHYLKIKADGECMSIKCLDISGEDLIDLGFKEGKEIGNTLEKLLNIVLEYPEKNTKEILKKKALKFANQKDGVI